jgi:mannose-6-phosphate isomerase-like protein (cupin superfamily)
MDVVNLDDKFSLIQEHWKPKIAGQVNDAHVKLVKLKGEFLWHKHDAEDELFLVVKGNLTIKLRDRDLRIAAGEFAIIPRGVEHMPVADEEVHVVLIEPVATLNTGDRQTDRTLTELERI